jgi:hypothetical protein
MRPAHRRQGALVRAGLEDAIEEEASQPDTPEGDANGQEERAGQCQNWAAGTLCHRHMRRPGGHCKSSTPLDTSPPCHPRAMSDGVHSAAPWVYDWSGRSTGTTACAHRTRVHEGGGGVLRGEGARSCVLVTMVTRKPAKFVPRATAPERTRL